MSRKQYELDSAIKEIEQLFKSTELIPKLYQSVESISRILCAIIKIVLLPLSDVITSITSNSVLLSKAEVA